MKSYNISEINSNPLFMRIHCILSLGDYGTGAGQGKL